MSKIIDDEQLEQDLIDLGIDDWDISEEDDPIKITLSWGLKFKIKARYMIRRILGG